MNEAKGLANLVGHPLGVHLAEPALRDVGREVAQRRILKHDLMLKGVLQNAVVKLYSKYRVFCVIFF